MAVKKKPETGNRKLKTETQKPQLQLVKPQRQWIGDNEQGTQRLAKYLAQQMDLLELTPYDISRASRLEDGRSLGPSHVWRLVHKPNKHVRAVTLELLANALTVSVDDLRAVMEGKPPDGNAKLYDSLDMRKLGEFIQRRMGELQFTTYDVARHSHKEPSLQLDPTHVWKMIFKPYKSIMEGTLKLLATGLQTDVETLIRATSAKGAAHTVTLDSALYERLAADTKAQGFHSVDSYAQALLDTMYARRDEAMRAFTVNVSPKLAEMKVG